MEPIEELFIFSGSTSTFLNTVEWGSWMRLAQPLIPLGITIWSYFEVANEDNGVYPVWFWLLPFAYFIIDASSVPLNIYHLIWSQSPKSQLLTYVNDSTIQIISFVALYINTFMIWSPVIMGVLTFFQQLIFEIIDAINEPDYEFGWNIRLSYSIVTSLPFLIPAVFQMIPTYSWAGAIVNLVGY